MATVSLEGINKVYENGFHAVKDLSVGIADGEFMVLAGPSGCGKTTALRMVAGLEDITSGTLRIGGKEANDETPKDRDIAMVFQNYALYPHMTVRLWTDRPRSYRAGDGRAARRSSVTQRSDVDPMRADHGSACRLRRPARGSGSTAAVVVVLDPRGPGGSPPTSSASRLSGDNPLYHPFPVSSAQLKVSHRELAAVGELGVPINVGSWRVWWRHSARVLPCVGVFGVTWPNCRLGDGLLRRLRAALA